MATGKGRFSNHVVVITGTGDGQGRTAALRLSAEGARVVGCDLNEELAAETAAMVDDAGGEYLSLAPLDLTDEDAAARLTDAAVERFGRIDALYNNAAGARLGTAMESSVEDFDFTVNGVLRIPWLVTRMAAPHLEQSERAAVVNTASIAGLVGAGMVANTPLLALYGAAKAAVIRLTTILAIELAPRGIRVNAVSPGMIDTPAVAPILGGNTESRLRTWHEEQLLVRRVGVPEDVVAAAAFLLSEEASYITGQNLVIDGGWVASGGVGQPRPEVLAELDESLGGGLRY